MKNEQIRLIVFFILSTMIAESSSTIDPAIPYAYCENTGWMNACADGTNGAVMGQSFCSGFLYGENVGWIHLGDGSPENGMAYGNNSATDSGINHDGLGNLTGYAYGANIGWLSFEPIYGQPKVDLLTGVLSGYVWGANIGWISLSNAFAHVRTQTIDPGPSMDGDVIPDAWELNHTNSIWVMEGGDSDGDGMSDVDEYLADTDPFDDGDYLAITDFQALESTNWVTWPVSPTRLYTLQHATVLSNGMSWSTTSSSFIPPFGPDVTEEVYGASATNRFYRVLVQPPLSP